MFCDLSVLDSFKQELHTEATAKLAIVYMYKIYQIIHEYTI